MKVNWREGIRRALVPPETVFRALAGKTSWIQNRPETEGTLGPQMPVRQTTNLQELLTIILWPNDLNFAP
jgi:hypothetical protein